MSSKTGKKVALKTEFISPFLSSTKSVLTTMAQVTVAAQRPYKSDSAYPLGDVAGIMPMATSEIVGQLILSFNNETILGIASKMLMEDFTEIDNEIMDSIGEITNMITGGAKALIEEKYNFDMARPVTVKKEEYEKLELTAPIQIVVPYETSVGPFNVELGFVTVE